MNTTSFTVAFWMKTNSAGKTNGHFVMGLAGWNGFQYEVFGGYDGSKFAIQYQLATGTAVLRTCGSPLLLTLAGRDGHLQRA
ncbi:MAG: hypothetical protein MZV63_69010 [Marinilabiliales bacterium]|nr:hypothetical protein [Marinilabiliales bacterium]